MIKLVEVKNKRTVGLARIYKWIEEQCAKDRLAATEERIETDVVMRK